MRTLIAVIATKGYDHKVHSRAKHLTQDLWIQFTELPYSKYTSLEFAEGVSCMLEPQVLLTEARAQLKHAAIETAVQTRKDLHDQLHADLQGHGTQGHNMTKEGLPPLTVTGDTSSYLQEQRIKWGTIWTGDHARNWTLPTHLRPPTTEAMQITPTDIQRLRKFCRSYHEKKSCGADQWQLRPVSLLPDEGLAYLAS